MSAPDPAVVARIVDQAPPLNAAQLAQLRAAGLEREQHRKQAA